MPGKEARLPNRAASRSEKRSLHDTGRRAGTGTGDFCFSGAEGRAEKVRQSHKLWKICSIPNVDEADGKGGAAS